MYYVLDITLRDLSLPRVWRKIEIPASFTFLDLHETIQTVFGYENRHLFEFNDGTSSCTAKTFRIGMPDDEGDYCLPKTQPAFDIKLSDVLARRSKLTYVYDFGDEWTYEIRVVKRVKEKRECPYCVEGEGATPPEDCGGLGGYIEMLQALSEGGEEAEQYITWLGLNDNEEWDPIDFPYVLRKAINLELYSKYVVPEVEY